MKIQVFLSVIFIAVCSSLGGAQINHCPSICHDVHFRARFECFFRTFHCETSRCGITGLQCGPLPTVTPTRGPFRTSPTVTPTRTPSPSPVPTRAYAKCTGDPHCETFDKLRFDCQARGEFILAESKGSPNFVLQGRFGDTPGHPSVSTGVVMIERYAPVFQISIPRLDTTKSRQMGGCPVSFFINAKNVVYGDGVHQIGQGARTQLLVDGSKATVNLPSGIKVVIAVVNTFHFGCRFNLVQIVIPGEVLAKTSFNGLLGSPNGNRNDDWSTRAGLPVPIPSNTEGLRGATAYQYCADNWGISEPKHSLFTHELEPEDYGDYFEKLDDAPLPVPDIKDAPKPVQKICDGNEDCLMDGVVGGVEDAENVIEAEEEAVDIADDDFYEAPPSVGPSRMLDIDDGKTYKKKSYSSYYSN